MSPWSGSNIVTVSVGPDRPVARLVCTRGVPMKIKFVVVTLSRLKAPTSETAAKRLLRKPNNVHRFGVRYIRGRRRSVRRIFPPAR